MTDTIEIIDHINSNTPDYVKAEGCRAGHKLSYPLQECGCIHVKNLKTRKESNFRHNYGYPLIGKSTLTRHYDYSVEAK